MKLWAGVGIGLALALSACNSQPEVKMENASAADVAKAVAASGASQKYLSAGQWRSESKVLAIDMPGLPPQVKTQMEQAMTKVTVNEQCITPEQAKHPEAGMFAGKEQSNCRYDHFTMTDGKMDAVFQCTGKNNATMQMAMNGTYEPNAYAMTAEMTMAMPNAPAPMHIKIQSSAKRVGECKKP